MSTDLDRRYSARLWFIERCSDLFRMCGLLIPNETWHRKMSAFFGVRLEVILDLDRLLKLLHEFRNYLLWTMHFLKCYSTESVATEIWHISEKTYRKRVKEMLQNISELDLINFDNRWVNWEHLQPSMSIDGTDFYIPESHPLRAGDFSHKFRHAGLRYEVGVALGSSNIVHIAGGFPAGEWADLKIARECLVPRLSAGEQAAADLGYQDGDHFFLPPYLNPRNEQERNFNRQLKTVIMSRYETVNKRFKEFSALSIRIFRHSRDQHILIFTAIAMIVQLTIQYEPFWDVKSRLS